LSIYIDSSFIVSLYLTDSHSSKARQRIQGGFSSFSLTPLHLAEWAHALAQQEFRGNLTPERAQQMNADLASDQASALWHQTSLPENAFELCVHLARKHGPKLGMRMLDSLHVACALELKAERFWTFDERQAKLARAEGLKTS
jgi:predicted nucleic acid-binding protein